MLHLDCQMFVAWDDCCLDAVCSYQTGMYDVADHHMELGFSLLCHCWLTWSCPHLEWDLELFWNWVLSFCQYVTLMISERLLNSWELLRCFFSLRTVTLSANFSNWIFTKPGLSIILNLVCLRVCFFSLMVRTIFTGGLDLCVSLSLLS